jgi:hypothetical protein
LPANTVASAFANRELYLVLANYGQTAATVDTTDAYVPVAEPATTAQKRWSLGGAVRQLVAPDSRRRVFAERRTIAEGIRVQAAAFVERYAERLTGGQREMLETFVHLHEAPFLRRRRLIVKYGFFHTGLARNIGRLVFG